MRNLLRAAFATMVLCTVACSPSFSLFRLVSGKQVQQKIDETIAPLISSYYPKLKVEPSRCEPVLILARGTAQTCTLTVDGVPLDIRVAPADPPYTFQVDFGGAFFFDMPTVEKNVERTLVTDYHISAVAHCGAPREQLLQPGTSWVCTIEGSPKVRSVKVDAAPNGQVFIHNVPGLKVAGLFPMWLLTVHKQGKATIVPGSRVKAVIQQLMTESPVPYPPKTVVTCPSRMDLTGHKRGECTVKLLNLSTPQKYGVWIDDVAGYRVKPINVLIDRDRIQKSAEDLLNRTLVDNGATADAVVVCEKGFIVVEMPGAFNCDVLAEGKHYKLLVAVDDQGKVNLSIPRDGGP